MRMAGEVTGVRRRYRVKEKTAKVREQMEKNAQYRRMKKKM